MTIQAADSRAFDRRWTAALQLSDADYEVEKQRLKEDFGSASSALRDTKRVQRCLRKDGDRLQVRILPRDAVEFDARWKAIEQLQAEEFDRAWSMMLKDFCTSSRTSLFPSEDSSGEDSDGSFLRAEDMILPFAAFEIW